MYLPKQFAETDIETLHQLIDEIAAATLVTCDQGEIVANQVPFILDRDNNCLLGHLAGPNPQLEDLAVGGKVLVNFLGPQGYISPNWYSDPGLVPTWNFVSVQVRGRAELLDDRDQVLTIVDQLSARHEAGFEEPWTSAKVPADKLDKLLSVIVGFRIHIEDIQGKLKLSQNREDGDLTGAVTGLREQPPARSLADFMDAAMKSKL